MRTAAVGNKGRGLILMTMTPLGSMTPLMVDYTDERVSGEAIGGRVFAPASVILRSPHPRSARPPHGMRDHHQMEAPATTTVFRAWARSAMKAIAAGGMFRSAAP